MTNPILGYDIDGQPLRAGDRVVIAGRGVYRCFGHVCTILGMYPDQQRYPGQIGAMDHDSGDEIICGFPRSFRKLPPKQDHEPGSWEEIAKLGWKPNLAPSAADC